MKAYTPTEASSYTSSPVKHNPFPKAGMSEMPELGAHLTHTSGRAPGSKGVIVHPTHSFTSVAKTFTQHEQRSGPIPHISMRPGK